jgi:hypothetical protein
MESSSAPLTRTPTLVGGSVSPAQNQSATELPESGPKLLSQGADPSRVDLGYFDSSGVQQLRETIAQQPSSELIEGPELHRAPTTQSEFTLSGIAPNKELDSWDFATALRQVVKQYAIHICSTFNH